MGSISTKRWMMAALIALLVSMMAIVTTADAIACGTEIGASQSILVLDVPEDDDQEPATETVGLCAHGHAHHGGVVLPAAAYSASTVTGATRAGPHSFAHPLASRQPSGPDRPPRA